MLKYWISKETLILNKQYTCKMGWLYMSLIIFSSSVSTHWGPAMSDLFWTHIGSACFACKRWTSQILHVGLSYHFLFICCKRNVKTKNYINFLSFFLKKRHEVPALKTMWTSCMQKFEEKNNRWYSSQLIGNLYPKSRFSVSHRVCACIKRSGGHLKRNIRLQCFELIWNSIVQLSRVKNTHLFCGVFKS